MPPMTVLFIIVAAVLALPMGLFVASLVSLPRARWLALLAGIVGDAAVAIAVYFYVTNTKFIVDGLDYFIGAFFACSMGVLAGALLANFLVSLGSRQQGMRSA
jgi:NAD/NADP transhydrogenase beta subunit